MLQASTTGPANRSSVVFLHGAGVAGWMWRDQVAGLDQFRCIVPDLPGHGMSRSTPWQGIDRAAGEVAELIRARAREGRAHVVGLSLGGHVALQLVAHYPDLVDRVLVSGTLVTGLTGARILAGLAALTLPLGRIGWMTTLSARALHVPALDREAHRQAALSLTPELLRRTVLDVAEYRPPPILASRLHSVLVLAGTREHRRIRASVAVLTSLLPNAVGGLVPGAAHTWNWQRPEAFTGTVRDWLASGQTPAGLRPA